MEILIFNISHTSTLEVSEAALLGNTADLKKLESPSANLSFPGLPDDGSSS
jgi:hypothetical protein